MGKAMLRVAVVMAALLALSAAAMADLTLNYEGAFDLPSAAGWTSYYYQTAAFVPHGNTRPGSGVAVTGPSLVIGTSHGGPYTREVNAFPALALLPTDPVGTATLVTNANGGTEYKAANGYRPYVTSVDSAGNLWTPLANNQWGPSMYSNPGNHVLGQNADPGLSAEAGWPASSYLASGKAVLRKGDGSGGDLATDGTTVGARFLTTSNAGSVNGRTHVWESTRVDASNMNSGTASLFNTVSNSQQHGIEYVRDTGGNEWFLLYAPGAHTGDSFMLDFFASNSAGAVDTPTEQFDIGPAIAAGPGWLDGDGLGSADSSVVHVTVDWDNSKLYVMDAGVWGSSGNRQARIHVFTLEDVVPPVPEPTGLGLVGLALLALRRRRS